MRGHAVNQVQKELSTDYAKDVDGVKDVINEMSVSKTSDKTHETMGKKIDMTCPLLPRSR
jgi:hyperosmotically inducible periplasmic protein